MIFDFWGHTSQMLFVTNGEQQQQNEECVLRKDLAALKSSNKAKRYAWMLFFLYLEIYFDLQSGVFDDKFIIIFIFIESNKQM